MYRFVSVGVGIAALWFVLNAVAIPGIQQRPAPPVQAAALEEPTPQFSHRNVKSTVCHTGRLEESPDAVTLCLTTPLSGTQVVGTQLISATATVERGSTEVRRMIFYLDDDYLLTDFEKPFGFKLPSDHFTDGPHVLSAEALLRDDTITERTETHLYFQNGITAPPVNDRSFWPHTAPLSDGGPLIVAAAGDGVSGRSEAQAVSDLIVSLAPDIFLYLGDVYERGSYVEFYNWYGGPDELFGRLRRVTNPTIGNHEYYENRKPDYFFYWDNIPHYYSYDAAGWHFIALDSTVKFSQTAPASEQYEWLLDDLAGNDARCTLVYFHHPVYSIGSHGDSEHMRDIWRLLAKHNVDIVLAGHDHTYQRWQPLDAAGYPVPHGITQFVHGAGGHGVRHFARSDERVAVGYDADSNNVFGALRLKLNPEGASFQYINIQKRILDSGVIPCEPQRPDLVRPTAPADLAATNGLKGVTLSWESARDNVGVALYKIYRNGVLLATVDDASTAYVDHAIQFDALYTYVVVAHDAAGNASDYSPKAVLRTADKLALEPVADAYVSAASPNLNHGFDERLRIDKAPSTVGYLRFKIPDLSEQPVTTTLRIYAYNRGNKGYLLYWMDDGYWVESQITYLNRPSLGEAIGAAPAFAEGSWSEFDLMAVEEKQNYLSVAMVASSTTNLNFSSREGEHPPQLVLEAGKKRKNAAPELIRPQNQRHQIGERVEFLVEAYDIDGDTLSYSAQGLPEGLSIVRETGQIKGTIEVTRSGIFTVTVTADDAIHSGRTTFIWFVDQEPMGTVYLPYTHN